MGKVLDTNHVTSNSYPEVQSNNHGRNDKDAVLFTDHLEDNTNAEDREIEG